jgi:CSLREA domain-containing protein
MRQFQRCVAVAALLLAGWAAPLPARAAPAAGHTYAVNSTLDEPDADPTNGICSSTPSGLCTLRAAIMESNFATGPNTILLPAGTYTITLPGYDDTALLGDLDIGQDLTLQGAGSDVTIVDGNSAVTGDRVFQILSTVQNVTLDGMTIRNGHALDVAHTNGESGGGIQTEGLCWLPGPSAGISR